MSLISLASFEEINEHRSSFATNERPRIEKCLLLQRLSSRFSAESFPGHCARLEAGGTRNCYCSTLTFSTDCSGGESVDCASAYCNRVFLRSHPQNYGTEMLLWHSKIEFNCLLDHVRKTISFTNQEREREREGEFPK